jgi:hypothetical protein
MYKHMVKHKNTMQQAALKKQRGMTFMGVVFTAAVIVFVAMLFMKLLPSYIEYKSVKQVIDKIAHEPDLANMSKQEIINEFDKGATVGYITVIKGSDLTIAKDAAGGQVVTAEYQVITPLVFNISALLDFKASTDNGHKAAKSIE